MSTQIEMTIKLRLWINKRGSRITGDPQDLLEPHIEHAAKMIREGYRCGELYADEYRGWWESEVVESSPRRKKGRS